MLRIACRCLLRIAARTFCDNACADVHDSPDDCEDSEDLEEHYLTDEGAYLSSHKTDRLNWL